MCALPEATRPAGRQLVADRIAMLIGLLAATGDGVLRARFLRSSKVSGLYVLSVDASGGAELAAGLRRCVGDLAQVTV